MATTTLDARMRDVGYLAAQAARIGWCWGLRTLAARATGPSPVPETHDPFPSEADVRDDLFALLADDRAAIRDGAYRAENLSVPGLERGPLTAARDFLRDARAVDARRRKAKGGNEIFDEDGPKAGYPRYYLQNFHFQSDGWFSRESAERYDLQVEVLFGGGADAMRRRALPPILAEIRRLADEGRKPSTLTLLDVACGAGGFTRELKANAPACSVIGLDLSPDYLGLAAERLAGWRRGVDFVQGPAEAMPIDEASIDIGASVFLFHELPKKARAAAAKEFARVLKPGGLFVFVDTILKGDHPPFDGLLDLFPVQFHEPYYADYVRSDPAALFEQAGLEVEDVSRAYFSRIMTLRKR